MGYETTLYFVLERGSPQKCKFIKDGGRWYDVFEAKGGHYKHFGDDGNTETLVSKGQWDSGGVIRKWGMLVGSAELHNFRGLSCPSDDAELFFYNPFDGNTPIITDRYDATLKQAPLSTVINWLRDFKGNPWASVALAQAEAYAEAYAKESYGGRVEVLIYGH